MPINTLQNWLAEFNMWLPAPAKVNSSANSSSNTVGSNNSNSSSDNMGSTTEQQQSIPTDSSSDIAMETNSTPEIRPRNFALHVLNDSHKSMAARSKVSTYVSLYRLVSVSSARDVLMYKSDFGEEQSL
jgi:RAD54-like protein 2